MKNYLPTLEECNKLVEENAAFSSTDEEFDGIPFRIFNYRLASYSDFLIPGAVEMRGITFNLLTGKRYLSIHKFFNHAENPFTIDEKEEKEFGCIVKWNTEKKLDIRDKRDGSLIQALLIKGNVVFKTKGSFYSEQTEICREQIDPELEDLLRKLLNVGYTPLLEYTSPENKIVVNYNIPELKIIQIRNLFGEYLTYDEIINHLEIPEKYMVERISLTFEEILKRQETEKGIEGWICFNPNVEDLRVAFRKVKTAEYFILHRLVSPNELVENKLIKVILDEGIDDILAVCNDFQRGKFSEMEELVTHYFNSNLKRCEELYKILQTSERKEFAIMYNKHDFFGVIMKSKSLEEVSENLKIIIKKRTSKLQDARKFLKNLKEEILI
jgi:T4 RnlA family RNA ligase